MNLIYKRHELGRVVNRTKDRAKIQSDSDFRNNGIELTL